MSFGNTHQGFAAQLGLKRPSSGAWWTFDSLLDAAVLKYWQRVYDDPARCPKAATEKAA